MSKHYLIPYVPIKGHKDPGFKELAYGESGQRGISLEKNLSKGSCLFFHTKIGSTKYITCFIEVERIIFGEIAQQDPFRIAQSYASVCVNSSAAELTTLQTPCPESFLLNKTAAHFLPFLIFKQRRGNAAN